MIRRKSLFIAAAILGLACTNAGDSGPYDIVILDARVMDPETRLDAVRNVGITDGVIDAITAAAISGHDTIDATGLVLAPGFIDLHAHGQDSVSYRLQALDGVTTALEMEIGVYPVGAWLASLEDRALINYGATVGHAGARMKLLTGVDIGHFAVQPPGSDIMQVWSGEHIYQELTAEQVAELGQLIAGGLDEGGLGIGFGITYTPGAARSEILQLFELAAARGAPAYVHLRGANSGGTLGAFQEVISNVASTGASAHIVHMNSSADEMARVTLQMIRGARERGMDVTTEAYPYTAGSTLIESALFDSWEGLDDSAYGRLQQAGTTERLNAATFRQYRAQGGWVVIHGRNEETNEWIVAQPDVMLASDGIPFLYIAAHPRGAGTFSRVLGYYTRERAALTLMEALAKMTILPARRLEGAAPDARRKGRVQEGADADLTIFDPETVSDESTYERPDAPSSGIRYVVVGGTMVVRDGQIVRGVFPGRPLRGSTPR
jgi:N-acyl-D-aspartate/D-glutamate deacylase